MFRKFFLVLIFFVFSNQTYAEKFIDLGPSLKLSYKTGNIDTNTFNGFASDISFFVIMMSSLEMRKHLKSKAKKIKMGKFLSIYFH